MTNLIIRRIPELQELGSLSGNEYIVAYDPASDTTRKIKASLLQGGTESVTTWVQSETYSQGQTVEWGLKLWKSKVNENQGNFPAENSFWEEVSRSEANGFGVWSPGVFTLNPSLVVRHERLYLLTAPVPFQSINFEDELELGRWSLINDSKIIGVAYGVGMTGNYTFVNLDDTLIVLNSGSVNSVKEGTSPLTISLSEPSYIVKTGAGNTLSDFTILPIFGGVGGHVIQNAAGTDMPIQPALQFGAGFTVTDETGKTVVGNTAASHIDGANEEKHTTNQIIQELELLKLSLPANSPLHTILQSIDNYLSGTLNTSEIDAGGWAISERRLAILENTINGIQIQGAALLLDIFAPPGVEASLRDNNGWSNETKTLTGNNSNGQLGQKGAMIWLNDAVYAQCTNSVLGVSGSATYRRNRAVDVLDPVNNTQDAAIANELDPSYTYPAMTPTGNSTDNGWNLTSQVKVITGRPTRWGMWFIGGINGDGYDYRCFLVSGTTSYWKRTGTPSSISRCIYAATHPNLTTRLLAHNFGTGAYAQVSGDEVTYADQTFYDATTRAYFIKMINGNWEKIR